MQRIGNAFNYLFSGTLYNTKKTESTCPKTIQERLQFIQKVGKLPIITDGLKDNMDKVLQYMIEYPDVLSIQRACCHTISNVAMEIDSSLMLMDKKAHIQVLKSLRKFHENDWKICWLGCSAIWNLARPEDHRTEFSTSVCDLALSIIKKYRNNERVINTAVGCLSNLCLDHQLKRYVGTRAHISLILQIIQDNVKNTAISSTGAGLIANLAVSDAIADILVESSCIYLITQLLNQADANDNTYQRNVAAALSNVITSPKFTIECLRHKTVEALFKLQSISATMGVIALIMNCFQTLDVDSDNWTTSYHMMCHHGYYDLLKTELLLWEKDGDTFNINVKDSRGATMLMYAVAATKEKIVSLLIKFQAEYDYLKERNSYPNILETIHMAEEDIKNATTAYNVILAESCQNLFPGVLSNTIVSFLPHSTLLFGVGLLK